MCTFVALTQAAVNPRTEPRALLGLQASLSISCISFQVLFFPSDGTLCYTLRLVVCDGPLHFRSSQFPEYAFWFGGVRNPVGAGGVLTQLFCLGMDRPGCRTSKSLPFGAQIRQTSTPLSSLVRDPDLQMNQTGSLD